MIKLYRRDPADPARVEYWEAWQSEPRLLTLHRGEVGDIGLTTRVKVGRFRSADKVMGVEADQVRAEGYAEVSPEQHVQVVLQLPMSDDPEADLGRLTEIEGICDEILGWTGNGHCDGHDIGAGTMNVFTETVLPDLAVGDLVAALAEHQVTDLLVAVRRSHEEMPEVVWPAGHGAPFNY